MLVSSRQSRIDAWKAINRLADFSGEEVVDNGERVGHSDTVKRTQTNLVKQDDLVNNYTLGSRIGLCIFWTNIGVGPRLRPSLVVMTYRQLGSTPAT